MPLLLWLLACGASVEALCGTIADCDGDVEGEALCLELWATSEEEAADLGCDPEHGELVTCLQRKGECVDGVFERGPCEAEEAALLACLDAPPAEG